MKDYVTYKRYEDIPEKKEALIFEIKQVETEQDNFLLIGCESDEI